MTNLTRADVEAVIGRVDDHLAAEVIGTGATREELLEAKTWLANDEPLMNAGRELANGRLGRLIDILGRADEDAPGVTGPEPG